MRGNARAGRLRFTNEPVAELCSADAVFVAVGTLPRRHGGSNLRARDCAIAEVVMTHLVGTLLFSQPRGSQLLPVVTASGLTSRVLAFRNLDLAAAGDFMDDGHLGVLLPTRSPHEIRYAHPNLQTAGFSVAAFLSLPGRLITNLSVASDSVAVPGLDVGLADDSVHLWLRHTLGLPGHVEGPCRYPLVRLAHHCRSGTSSSAGEV